MATRLLCHPNGGVLAVIGNVGIAGTTSFTFSDCSQIKAFDSTFKRLLSGHPIGSAMEYVNQRHAELSVDLCTMFMARENLLAPSQSRSHFERVWKANNDARNFIVLGDPAVRLTWAE